MLIDMYRDIAEFDVENSSDRVLQALAKDLEASGLYGRPADIFRATARKAAVEILRREEASVRTSAT